MDSARYCRNKMLTTILVFLVVSKTAFAQINGEFWWLNDKVTKLKGVEAPQPKFDELTEFDTDESARITFRDDQLLPTGKKIDETNSIVDNINKLKPVNIVFPDETYTKLIVSRPNKNKVEQVISVKNEETTTPRGNRDKKQKNEDNFLFKYPDDEFKLVDRSIDDTLNVQEESESHNTSNISSKPMPRHDKINNSQTENAIKKNYEDNNHTDIFTFKFPDENLLSKNSSALNFIQKNESDLLVIDNSNSITGLLHDNAASTETKESLSENICTYTRKRQCYENNGFVYYISDKKNARKLISTDLVCCIVPLPTADSHKIVFPDSSETYTKRYRRSNKEESNKRSLKQRDFLLEQRFRPKNTKPTTQTKVATLDYDDYLDPYLNIKGSSTKTKPHSSIKQDCDDSDYVEDYIVELPKPGLVGLYSDNAQRPPWMFANENNNRPSYGASTFDESEEDEEPSFGYSTVDPRRGSSKAPKRGRPSKLTTSTPELPFDVESQTVSFQSTPNFQVFQGFKLLNLGRNKNKFYSKNTRRSTTEGSVENDSIEPDENGRLSLFDGQVFENCGKTKKFSEIGSNDKQFGDAESGSHPWMALVVLSRRPQGILCYATIVHPRAAVTAGDCVYGRTSPKQVILIAGLWNLSDRSRTQNRITTVQLHPQYRAKILAHDLALLHWKTPLTLNANVQPACLGLVRDTADCKIFGWGGFDQGIRQRSRWQRASLLSAQECIPHFSKAVSMPDDAFCATVETRGTVTGIGGPLICTINDRKLASGVAVWRDNALVLIPAQEWVLRAFQDLDIQ